MKKVGRLSLRMRITLLSGTILLICSGILTLGSYYNSRLQFNDVTLAGTYQPAPSVAIPSNQPQLYLNGTGTAVAIPSGTTLTTARRQFDTTNLIILLVVSAFGMGMVYLVAGKSLCPIHELSKTISEISAENLRQRIPEEGKNDEVGVLGHSFNIMLDRLEASFLRQKRFSANVAHELKTPLATINAGIQVLHLDSSPTVSDYEENLATIERNVKRLIAVVDDLLTLYDKNEKPETSPVNLKYMFESILNELQPILEERHIETELRCSIENVSADPTLFYRACFNLIENAVKYNKQDGKILIETKVKGREGQIIITDTGIGIPEDEIKQIFEPFYRVNKSRSRKAGGAGLGLSIVKSIIEKHGWQISVNSTLGVGSTFTIFLRL